MLLLLNWYLFFFLCNVVRELFNLDIKYAYVVVTTGSIHNYIAYCNYSRQYSYELEYAGGKYLVCVG